MEHIPRESEPQAGERATIGTIIKELEHTIEEPTNGDIRIAAFAQAARQMLHDHPDSRLKLSIEFMLDIRRELDSDDAIGKKEEPFTAQYASNLLLRAFQHTILFKRTYPVLFHESGETMLNYPADFDSPDVWLYEMDTILDNSTGHSALDYDLTKRRIQSNVADRYKGPKLAILKDYAERFKEPLRILDVGASLNLGLTKLAVGDAFKPVQILNAIPSGGEAAVDGHLSQSVNELINRPLELSEGVGIDILPGWDLNSREWIRSCSFYPSEFLDPEITAEFDRLLLANLTLDKNNRQKSALNIMGLNMDKLSTHIGDFSDRNSMREFSQTLAAKRKFHLVTFITMMHQLSDMERTAMIDRAKRYLLPGGLIIIQDFMRVNTAAPNCLEFPHRWDQFLYRTAVIDPSEQKAQPREVIIWDYGRCQQAVLV